MRESAQVKRDKLVLYIAALAIAVGALVLIGWVLGIKAFLSVFPQAATMKFNTALLFLLSGTTLLLVTYDRKIHQVGSVTSIIVIIGIAATTLIEYISGATFLLDNFFIKDVYSALYPGRMSMATASCFLLTGLSLAGLFYPQKIARSAVQAMMFMVASIAFIALVAYLLQIPVEDKHFFLNTMAIHTSLLFLLLSWAISSKNGSIAFNNLMSGVYTGSKLARLILPLTIILPVTLSYLLLLSFEYNLLENNFGVVLYTVVLILFSIFYVTIIALQLNRTDVKRHQLDNLFRNTNQELAYFKEGLDKSAIVTITDANGVIGYVNDKFCQVSKYDRKELIGKTHRIINSGHHPKEFFKEMWDTIKSGKVWVGEIKNKAKDGQFYWVLTSIIPFRNEMGEIYQYLSIRQDITKRVESEEFMSSQYVKRLRRKNKELEQFAYIASHDLKEPLRSVESMVELLNLEYKGKLGENADQYLKFITDGVARMKLLIKNLLEYSRIGINRELTTVDCNAIIADLRKDLSSLISDTKTTIEACELPKLQGYESELRTLCQNLITNAIKFRKKNTSPVIKISAERDNGNWKFAFEDNGIGIPAEHQKEIFVIFKRLHAQSEFEGSGIGLANCQKVVELHGGEIWVESTPDVGSTFYFTIPIKVNKPV